MALSLAACRPVAARRPAAPRRAPAAARRPRLLQAVKPPEPAPPPPPAPRREDEKQPRKPRVHPLVAFLFAILNPLNLMRVGMHVVAFITLTRVVTAGMGKAGGAVQPAAAPPVVRQVRQAAPYSEFLRAAKTAQVNDVLVDGKTVLWMSRQAATVTAPAKALRRADAPAQAVPAAAEPQTVYVSVRPDDAAVPYDALLASGASFRAQDHSGDFNMAATMHNLMYWVVNVAFLAMVFSAVRGGVPGMSLLKGRAAKSKRGKRESTQVTFADVAGCDEAKEELMEVVEILKSPERFTRLGARPPTGVLLVGPPGTGKTLLAKAVAGEAGVPFFSVAASEFVELYVGMGASRVREVFGAAKAAAPCIVFIDEIDAVAKSRGDGRMRYNSNDEREQTLNQLLTELDGFDSSKLVICLAATNRVDTLDSAIRRPGRFDRTVAVEPPDRTGREEILGVHVRSKKVPLAPDVALDDVAKATPGFTGAELANVVNEAALLAARRGETAVDAAAFDAAVMRAVAGIERKRSLLQGFEKAAVARHEAGHAIVGAAVSALLPSGTAYRTESISLSSRSNGVVGSLGSTRMAQDGDDRSMFFADEFRGQLAMMLGGRAAEELSSSGRISAGAADDIKRATKLAYAAVAEWGFSASVGPVAVPTLVAGSGEVFGGDGGAAAAAVEAEVQALLKGALGAARAVLSANASLLDRLGATLEADEKVAGPRLAAFLAQAAVPQALRDFVTAPQAEALRLLPPPKDGEDGSLTSEPSS